MTTFAVFLGMMVVFVIGIVSPYMAGKIQRRTKREASWLKRCANWLWDPLTWWVKNSLELIRMAVVKVASWGKKIRGKLPF